MPRADPLILEKHSTRLVQLKPVNIVQAAQADLKLRDLKKEKKADPDALYSFARKHVNRAVSVGHLVALAFFDPDAAKSTDKKSTYVVYHDRSLLKETLLDLIKGEPV